MTSALFFTAAGLIVNTLAPGMLDTALESAVVERVAEVALALLLFSDAARLDLRVPFATSSAGRADSC